MKAYYQMPCEEVIKKCNSKSTGLSYEDIAKQLSLIHI